MEILCSPHTEDIESYLRTKDIIHQRYLHLTPTLILFRRRVQFYLETKELKHAIKNNPAINQDMKSEDKVHQYVHVFEINHFVKTLLKKVTERVLNKAEATVVLERIITTHPATNNPSWFSVTFDLYDLFSEFSQSGLSTSTLRGLDQSAKWQLVLTIYETYLAELEALNVSDRSLTCRRQLESLDISDYAELVLDGAFLPITPVLQVIIDKFHAQGKPIITLLPFDLDQPEHPALKAITRVYENFKSKTDWISIQSKHAESPYIRRLPKLVFQNGNSTNLDTSLQILRFQTGEEELHYIMQSIYVLLKHKGVLPKQVVLVTPGVMEIRPLIREISEQYNLRVHLPKRPLLHLNQGRAIKHLFDIRVDMRKEKNTYMTTKIIKVFLNDSILKNSPKLLDAFEKVEGFFEDCISIEDFTTKLNDLVQAKGLLEERHEQHPLNSVTFDQLNELNMIVQFLGEVSLSLVSAPIARVSEHVQQLITRLQTDEHFRELDPDIWDRIESISTSASGQRNLPITGIEFGTRVSALFNESEEFEPGEQPIEDETDIDLKREILVTGPNNVEFQRYDYVFLCRFTQDIYPEPKRYTWLKTKQVEQLLLQYTTAFKLPDTKSLDLFYLDRSIYHIYLALSAPRIQLTISYAKMDNGQPLTPAHYLHDIARTFRIEEGNRLINKKEKTLEQLLEENRILKSPSKYSPAKMLSEGKPIPWNLIGRSFTAEDVAVFHYCPRRFYYQSQYTQEHVYNQMFHLQSYATSCLYEKTVELFVQKESFPITESIDTKKQLTRLNAVILERRAEAEQMVRPLFPLSNRLWHNIRVQTDFFLRSLLHSIFDGNFIRELHQRGNSIIKVQMTIANQDDIIQVDDFSFSSIRELEVQYLGLETHRYSISNRKDILSFSSSDHDEKETMEEMKRWYTAFKREFKKRTPSVIKALEQVVNGITTGSFPKQTGGHCMYCSFNKICREREVDSC
ncbi:hypothetical protein ACFFSY_00405 [Paenibacillus aurantiacus]|uniref:PD-(D/E)XK endonuclease-like domain-containing protein n=1 Tax=Paenibacillus aurantiacus TaxID=1936118 RepID=A0ABV5KIG1_9BACL